MSLDNLRVLSIQAHQDDFELNCGGTFALLRQAYDDRVTMKVLATSRGASGHHEMRPDELFVRRSNEAKAAAALIGAEYECLTQLDGSHVEMQVMVDRNLLGGLWNAIRAFEPDVIFCPPVAADPLAGVHVDHANTAEAVRLVAYQIMVPHAYPTLGGPIKKWVGIPLIINVDDVYAGEAGFDVRHDIREVYELKERMALCHESQVLEWLTFSDGRAHPITADQWREKLRLRHERTNARYGRPDGIPSEYFRITRWGRAPKAGELAALFPKAIENRCLASAD